MNHRNSSMITDYNRTIIVVRFNIYTFDAKNLEVFRDDFGNRFIATSRYLRRLNKLRKLNIKVVSLI